jgi:hypothetical protein
MAMVLLLQPGDKAAVWLLQAGSSTKLIKQGSKVVGQQGRS